MNFYVNRRTRQLYGPADEPPPESATNRYQIVVGQDMAAWALEYGVEGTDEPVAPAGPNGEESPPKEEGGQEEPADQPPSEPAEPAPDEPDLDGPSGRALQRFGRTPGADEGADQTGA